MSNFPQLSINNRWLGGALIAVALTGTGVWHPMSVRIRIEAKQEGVKMNPYIPLYSWVRSGALVCLGSIAHVRTQPGRPGQEDVALDIQIAEILWGKNTERLIRYAFSMPAGDLARVKFPDWAWEHVTLRDGTFVFLVTHDPSKISEAPVYVEESVDRNDPVLKSVRAVLIQEKAELSSNQRLAHYLRWLLEGPTVQRLFAAEALAKDNLPEFNHGEQVATAFTKVFASERDPSVQLSLGTWMWENIYPRTNAAGQVAIINAVIQCIADSSEDTRVLMLDHFVDVDPAELRRPGVVSSPTAVRQLEERLNEETDPQVHAHVQRLIDALKRHPAPKR